MIQSPPSKTNVLVVKKIFKWKCVRQMDCHCRCKRRFRLRKHTERQVDEDEARELKGYLENNKKPRTMKSKEWLID